MGRKEILLAFLEFLKEKCAFQFNVNNFENRLKLQKYVFIAGFLGLNHGYTFNRYLRGPYSRELADDYYSLPRLDDLERAGDYSQHLENFDNEKFLDVTSKKSPRWLEIAATILSVWNDYRGIFREGELKTRIIDTVTNIKSTATPAEISEKFEELERKKVLQL